MKKNFVGLHKSLIFWTSVEEWFGVPILWTLTVSLFFGESDGFFLILKTYSQQQSVNLHLDFATKKGTFFFRLLIFLKWWYLKFIVQYELWSYNFALKRSDQPEDSLLFPFLGLMLPHSSTDSLSLNFSGIPSKGKARLASSEPSPLEMPLPDRDISCVSE